MDVVLCWKKFCALGLQTTQWSSLCYNCTTKYSVYNRKKFELMIHVHFAFNYRTLHLQLLFTWLYHVFMFSCFGSLLWNLNTSFLFLTTNKKEKKPLHQNVWALCLDIYVWRTCFVLPVCHALQNYLNNICCNLPKCSCVGKYIDHKLLGRSNIAILHLIFRGLQLLRSNLFVPVSANFRNTSYSYSLPFVV